MGLQSAHDRIVFGDAKALVLSILGPLRRGKIVPGGEPSKAEMTELLRVSVEDIDELKARLKPGETSHPSNL